MADQAGRNVRDLRRSNRSLLLRHLYFHDQVSRQDLSRATGLSTASVSNVVAEMIEAGIVVEAGAVESEGGRPRILLEVDASRFQVIGVDVGETHVRVERFDLALNELARADIPMSAGHYEPEVVVTAIATGIEAVGYVQQADGGAGAGPGVLGVGIGVPGIVQGLPESLVHCQTIGWDGVPLEAMLRKATDLPLFIDNGATTMGQAEMWFGAGREAADTVFLLIGSGVGASVLAGGAPYRGSSTSAGEWGHVTAVIGGRRCRCGARGCLEAYIGAESVIARYREAVGEAPEDVADEESELRRILRAADQEQSTPEARAARAVLDDTALHIGVGIGNLVNLFNPERVIIGGWAGLLLAGRLLPRITDVAREHALHYPFSRTAVELGRLGPDAVARGAATLPVARFLNSGGAPARPAALTVRQRP
ncbi:ROK family transcriptional regulator [Streptacidiphilus sp. PB12-B1b]|uniref:ROK family transcriptional regulator n=1 Tax=Streptacidiphilus sp. PB12-B1b TaxID=2705012 RepID=UPI0015FD955F|nr:ROK family transcriptional regulator [Streptacidiphilus sp. PB12-B1b]QMU75400.1 ROK family transcriptional regulator [Streptacidiphilus sp. PB12-B1b]